MELTQTAYKDLILRSEGYYSALNPTPDPSPNGRGDAKDTASPLAEHSTSPLPLGEGPGVGLKRLPYGGAYIPEVLLPGLQEIAAAFDEAKYDEDFLAEFHHTLKTFSGRPTAFTPLPRLSAEIGGAQLFLKNEGLNHTGAHKITHCIGQILLAKRLGKQRIIAETGAGQHGYATAAVCARFGLDCTVYMGRKDYERQRPNVYWMELLGTKVVAVEDGDQTLNDAVIAAFKDWVANPGSYYLLGSAVGPHPYPAMNTFFQKVVGEEIRDQCQAATGRLPDYLVACVGGGSNAMGMFFDFLDDEEVALVGVEAGGRGTKPGEHAAKVLHGKLGIFEGYHSYFLQDGDGNIAPTHSVSAGLDYCGVSPILAFLADEGRVRFETASDEAALAAVKKLAQTEGIIPALESAHAFAHAFELAAELPKDNIVVVNASGRGEKDLFITMRHFQEGSLKSYAQHLLKSL
ncbi:MAG TPA: tryptophan synthase subunit beta [Saprospiraceae bacterium]|nr:tryptophan synthase subunit beta [Saprospiraceae bacterium]